MLLSDFGRLGAGAKGRVLRAFFSVGDSLFLDVFFVYYNSILLRYFVFLLGYGFYGDIIKDSEKKRWMGFVRYNFLGNLR